MFTVKVGPKKKLKKSNPHLHRVILKILVIDRFIIDALNDHFVVPVIICPKSNAYSLLIIDVRDAVSNSKSLVKSEMNRENQGFIPSPHIKKGHVDSVSDLT